MTRLPFLTILTFLTQKLCCRAFASGPRQYLGLLPYGRRERLKPPTVGLDGGDTTRRSVRRRLPDRGGHELLDFEHGGIRYTAGAGKSLRFGVSITTGGFENWTAHFALSNFISALVV